MTDPVKYRRVKLKAKTLQQARAEVRRNWPDLQVTLKGYAKGGQLVYSATFKRVGGIHIFAQGIFSRAVRPMRYVAEVYGEASETS